MTAENQSYVIDDDKIKIGHKNHDKSINDLIHESHKQEKEAGEA